MSHTIGKENAMRTPGKIAIIAASTVTGAAIITAGIFVGAKYIPYAVEEARHKERMRQLDNRAGLSSMKNAVGTVKDKIGNIAHR